MALTDIAVRSAKPREKAYRLYDTGGLYVEVSPAGSKLWRVKYRFDGKEKRLAVGTYPELGLKEARERRDEARKLLANGIDPGEYKKAVKAARIELVTNNFEAVAREWFVKHQPTWAKSHADKVIRRLERDIFPWIGKRPTAEITAMEVLNCLRRIEDRKAIDTAHRALQNCGQVFRYAVHTGRAQSDPTRDLRGALPPAKPGHFAAITDPEEIGPLLRAMDAVNGTFVVKCALRLAPYLFCRPGELRHMRWKEIDFDAAKWSYWVTKSQTSHQVPLASQVISILRDLQPLTGRGEFVFPGARDKKKPMSDGAINNALRRAGYSTREEQTGHGFRAMARTVLHEGLDVAPEIIEHQLAHRVPDALGNAYNRTKFIKARQEIMQKWADYLDSRREGTVETALLQETSS
ncbi:integrase arm-type DNA-binding domain-containing protein [Chromobacterium vaccinii]|nr:integrase arm-type DNA-binding domain-containing protein [Chromobacterium vaccinii]